MATRFWVYRTADDERVGGPFETETGAAECARVLEAETDDGYDHRPHP